MYCKHVIKKIILSKLNESRFQNTHNSTIIRYILLLIRYVINNIIMFSQEVQFNDSIA